MEERFMKPAAAGIIEKIEDGKRYVLLQDREKVGAEAEAGLCEIPAGKIREFENIYDCLRREIWEETGLTVTEIEGEENAFWFESHGYRVLQYTPFASTQNISEVYPIMVQTFICRAIGKLAEETNETKNLRWVEIEVLQNVLEENLDNFYPMHVMTLKKYIFYNKPG
ncbi:NUDIX domain-containing protein [Gottschalkiaceae bacterium SANA]|nr:NUDIX domain-containing protein [Gottschalkiaceae bacterium SANA]